MKVMMFAMMDPKAAQEPPTQEAILAMHQFNEELEKAGKLVDLGGLQPRSVRVAFSGKKRTVLDGPFAEAKEVIAGFSILEVANLEEAIDIAKRSPFVGEGTCELRPFFDPSKYDPSDR